MNKIQGIFSSQSMTKTGTGTTTRRTINKQYWIAQEQDDNTVEIQPLNKNYVPSGPKKTVSREHFLEGFSIEPEFYVSTVLPAMRELEKTIQKGEKHRQQGEVYSAEFEYGTALKLDEENVRATFGLGLTYMDRGDTSKAEDVFRRVVDLEATFEKRHKHLFNEFGMGLRKSRMLPQALEYYQRALELTDDDENLLVNIARVHYERGDIRRCILHLKEALKLNPELPEGKQFWSFLERNGHLQDLNLMDVDKELARLKDERLRRMENKRDQRRRQAMAGDASTKVYK